MMIGGDDDGGSDMKIKMVLRMVMVMVEHRLWW